MIMNFEKIGQFIGTILLLGAGMGWYKVDNWTIQLTVIMALSGIFIIWAGSRLEDTLQTRRVRARYQKEEEIDDKLEEKDYDKDLYHFGKDDPED